MTLQNPLALAANTLRQIGESGTQAVSSLGNGVAQTASTLLRGLGNGAPALPLGLPALPGLGGNGAAAGAGPLGLPAIGQLVPVQAVQAISTLENAVVPPGLPRVASLLMSALGVNGAPTPEPAPVETGIIREDRSGARVGLEGLNGVRQPSRDLGIQIV